MADKTRIEWAANADGAPGATWNPIRARDRETGRVERPPFSHLQSAS